MKQAGNLCEFVIDTSETLIEGKSIDSYAASRSNWSKADFNNDMNICRAAFIEKFNKKNSNGMQMTTSSAPYKLTYKLKSLDLGNTALSFLTFTKGGCNMSGTAELSKDGQVIATIDVVNQGGGNGRSESLRLELMFKRWAKKLIKDCLK